ncbi:MAG: hypothetical protein ACT4PO_13265 [Actinomycetota bacterium]
MPKAFAVGELVSGATLNTYVRDNLLETEPAKITAAEDLIRATGPNALARVAVGANGQYCRIIGGVPAASGGASPAPTGRIAAVYYDPVSLTTISWSAPTPAAGQTLWNDVDATNLALTVTPPGNGRLFILLSAVAVAKAAGANGKNLTAAWGLRVGSATVVRPHLGTEAFVVPPTGIRERCSHAIVLEGLAPTSQTFRWIFSPNSYDPGTATIRPSTEIWCGGESGPAIMEAWTLPDDLIAQDRESIRVAEQILEDTIQTLQSGGSAAASQLTVSDLAITQYTIGQAGKGPPGIKPPV